MGNHIKFLFKYLLCTECNGNYVGWGCKPEAAVSLRTAPNAKGTDEPSFVSQSGVVSQLTKVEILCTLCLHIHALFCVHIPTQEEVQGLATVGVSFRVFARTCLQLE